MDRLQKAMLKGAISVLVGDMILMVLDSLEDDPSRDAALEALLERAVSEMRRRRGPQETAGYLMVVADRIPVMED